MANIQLNLKKSQFIPKFYPMLLDYSHRWELWCGSAGSGKSYTIAQRIVIRCCNEPIRVLVCRRYGTTLRNSCFALFKEILAKWRLTKASKMTIEYEAVPSISYSADEQGGIEKFVMYHDLKSDLTVTLPEITG